MGLREYMKLKDCSVAEFCSFYQVATTTIYNIIAGKDFKFSTAIALTELTKGQVTLQGLSEELQVRKDLKTSRFPGVEEKFA